MRYKCTPHFNFQVALEEILSLLQGTVRLCARLHSGFGGSGVGTALDVGLLAQVLYVRNLVTEARSLKMYKASRDTFIVSGRFLRFGYRS